jgi:uncharacterized protein (UPF0218 family)
MLILPEDKRIHFKRPFGVVYPDIRSILAIIPGKIIFSVGDVVTRQLICSGVLPAVAVIDGHTMREPVSYSPPTGFSRTLRAKNPPGTLTPELVRVLKQGVADTKTLIEIEGEEDLAVIPLVIEAPLGAVILYGQPGEGIVLCEITPEAKEKAREMLGYFIETEKSRSEMGEGTRV